MEIALEQLTHAKKEDVIVDQKVNAREDPINVQKKNANVVRVTNALL